MALKRTFIRFLAGFFRGISRFCCFLLSRSGFLRAGINFIGKVLFYISILPVYRLYFYIKYKIINIYTPAKSKFFYFLNKTYIIHLFIVIVALLVVVDNIKAQDIRQENYGEQTLAYSLITKEEYEELTEETLIDYPVDESVLNYLDSTGNVESQRGITGATSGGGEAGITDFSTITEGGGVVVKPNIMRPVTPEEAQSIVEQEEKRYSVTKYTVQAGDSFSSIADKFNISVNTILWQNNLSERSTIRPGDTLEILPTSGVLHKVKSGETLGSIAQKYGIDANVIVTYNNLVDAGTIKINQQLIIPGARVSVPYKVPATSVARGSTQVAPITKLFIPPKSQSSGSGLFWPAGVKRISQYYSWRHKALDIAGPTGTAVYAADSGTVTYSGWTKGYGNNIIIDHGNGMKTRYGHASKLFVAKGDVVVKGQTIMAMGSTGWSTGPHVHFEVNVNGVLKNPLSYVK